MNDDRWYRLDVPDVLQRLGTDGLRGLSPEEAERRRLQGTNESNERSRRSPWLMLWEQLSSATMVLLLGSVRQSLQEGSYEPSPVRRVTIPKPREGTAAGNPDIQQVLTPSSTRHFPSQAMGAAPTVALSALSNR